ncbi:MAG: HEAT repeat domain-containing protein [Gaiellaceae bacterium]
MSLTALVWAALAITAAGSLSAYLLSLRRIYLVRSDRRHLAGQERLALVAVQLADGELPEAELTEADVELVAELLARYSRQLTGAARFNIADFFECHGLVGREISHLADRRSWRRARAAFLLGDMSSPQALDPLLAALDDPSREVRSAAARSLGFLGSGQAVEPLVHALVERRVPRAIGGQALLTLGSEALGPLRPLVLHAEPDVRAAAVELVGLFGDPGDARLLTGRLRDSAAEVRAKAARALGRLGAEEATAELREALSDRIGFVRANAAVALGLVGDRASSSALLEVARSDEFDPAQAAARALSRLYPQLLWSAARERTSGPHLAEAADLTAVAR